MRTLICALVAALVLVVSACSTCPNPANPACNSGVGGGGGTGAGSGGGGGLDVYDRYTLDTAPSDRFYMALVTSKTSNRVGVAYFTGMGENPIIYLPGDDGGITTDGGTTPFYDVKYVEWEDGMVRAPQTVDSVQRMIGIAVDFHPTTGEPAVAYLGGGSDNVFFWFNSDAELATRTGGTTWTNGIIGATNGNQTFCGDRVSDVDGPVVGLYPAIRYDSTGLLTWCYRDVHNGQFPQQDWAGSDLECIRGTPPAVAASRECTKAGGPMKDAPGGHNQMLMINDVPYVFYDKVLGGADTSGQDVNYVSRTGPGGTWTAPRQVLSVAGTQQGASVAYDSEEGIGVAVVDVADNVLRYVRKSVAAPNFDAADTVYGEGTGGWYPSLAMDPAFHEPAISFYVCSDRQFANVSQCKAELDEVRVAQRNSVSNQWNIETVDTSTVITTKLGFLPNGRKVIAYRERGGPLKLAVRKVP
ncbi:MAG: hypothetical protein JNK82_16335 [Myxococcaceae bacterium]|nr:hypothetical protein [Myxococcaceae bacterium]